MLKGKRSYVISLLLSLLLVLSFPFITSCGGLAVEDTTVTEEPEESTPSEGDDGESPWTPPDSTQVPMMGIDMEKLGGILGIEPEELEAAFSQAIRDAFSSDGTFPREDVTGGQPPGDFNGEPPEFSGEPPDDMPDGERPEGGFERQPGIPEEVMTRVAEILNIDLQELENAISQLGSQAP